MSETFRSVKLPSGKIVDDILSGCEFVKIQPWQLMLTDVLDDLCAKNLRGRLYPNWPKNKVIILHEDKTDKIINSCEVQLVGHIFVCPD